MAPSTIESNAVLKTTLFIDVMRTIREMRYSTGSFEGVRDVESRNVGTLPEKHG